MTRKPGSGKRIVLFLLLALFCVAGVELLVCSRVDPPLFQRLTRPFSQAMEALRRIELPLPSGSSAQPEEDPPVNQLASAPAVAEDPTMEDPKITEFVTEDGVERLTGGNVPLVYYNQGEEPWADQLYGPDPIRGYGCGPTAMAMVVSSLSTTPMDPAEMAVWAAEKGYCAPGSGSYSSLVLGTAEAFGLEAESWSSRSADDLTQALASGNLFVALMTKGHFTANGHFILLRGITLEGNVLVADPNSRSRSLTAWDPQLILDELSASRSSGAPLWRFPTLASPDSE